MKLTVACVQNNPVIGQFKDNLEYATKLVEGIFESNAPDMVILPELALSGYNFPSPEAIEPHLETTASGPTTEWAIKISKRFGCFTLIGYPEKFVKEVNDKEFTIYNSAVLISPSGSLIKHYRKHFMYDADYVWGCSESPDGFQSFKLILDKDFYLKSTEPKPESVIQTSIGICMDICPYLELAPFEKYEYSNFCVDNEVELVLCPTAWPSTFSPHEKGDKELGLIEGKELSKLFENATVVYNTDVSNEHETALFEIERKDAGVVDYWIRRFTPYLTPKKNLACTVICCNRTGVEDDVMYAGSTSIFRIDKKGAAENNAIKVYGSLTHGDVGVLIREIDV